MARQQAPGRNAQGAGHVDGRVSHGHDQIECRDLGRKTIEIDERIGDARFGTRACACFVFVSKKLHDVDRIVNPIQRKYRSRIRPAVVSAVS